MTNVNRPGMFMFQLGGPTIGLPDLNVYPASPETCSNTEFPCLQSANCLQYSTGICCECQTDFFGNGRTCLKRENGIHINGRISGTINDIRLEEPSLYNYVDLKQAIIYTTVRQVTSDLGYDIQAALPALSGVFGWLFALSEGAPNGFTLTGGILNRTVNVVFPQTGQSLRIVEQFNGFDIFGFLNHRAEIHGYLPTIPSDVEVTIKPYTEEYRLISDGTIKSHMTHHIRFGANSQPMPMTIDQTIMFENCKHRPSTNYSKTISQVSVAANHMAYESGNLMTRFAFESKIAYLTGDNPCSSVTCGLYSSCFFEGDRHQCRCNDGFEGLSDDNDDDPVCQDINECEQNRCHVNARCENVPGSFRCSCREGFIGDGFTCTVREGKFFIKNSEYSCSIHIIFNFS